MARKEMNEKVRPLILRDTETNDCFTLEFSRESVKFAEARGFVLEDVSKFPMTKIPEFFFYAFRMHHKNVARERTDRIIFEDWGGISEIPDGVLERLGQLYTAPFTSMQEESGEPKNVRMTVEF